MSRDAAVLFLDEARAHRTRAERVREVLRYLNNPDVRQSLLEYALDLESKAEDLEQRASELQASAVALQQTMGRSEERTSEGESEITRPTIAVKKSPPERAE